MLRSSRTACSKVASSIRASDRATPIVVGEGADRLGRHAPAAQPGDGRHPGIVPSRHVPVVHQPEQLPLAQDGVVELEPGELGLLRRPLESRLAHQPVVDVAVVLELERAERVGDALDRVGQPVGEVVQRVEAPRRCRDDSAPRAGCAAAAGRASACWDAPCRSSRGARARRRGTRRRACGAAGRGSPPTGRSRYGLGVPGAVTVPRPSRISSSLCESTYALPARTSASAIS